jgi:hypothetical protein
MAHELHSTLDASQLSFRRAARRLLPACALAAAVVIIPLFIALGVTLVSVLVAAFVLCFCFAWIYVILTISAGSITERLPRSAIISEADVTITSAQVTEAFPWTQCRWSLGTTAQDEYAIFLDRQPAVVLETPSRRLTCVPNDGDMSLWVSLLEANTDRRRLKAPWSLVAISTIASAVSSVLLGYACNAALDAIGHGLSIELGWLIPAGIGALAAAIVCLSAGMDPYFVERKLKTCALEIVCGTYSFFVGLAILTSVIGTAVFGIVFTLHAHFARRLALYICAYTSRPPLQRNGSAHGL